MSFSKVILGVASALLYGSRLSRWAARSSVWRLRFPRNRCVSARLRLTPIGDGATVAPLPLVGCSRLPPCRAPRSDYHPSFAYSFLHLFFFVYSFAYLIPPLIYSFVYPFVYPFVSLFLRLCISLFILSFIYLFLRLCISLLISLPILYTLDYYYCCFYYYYYRYYYYYFLITIIIPFSFPRLNAQETVGTLP